MSSLCKNARNFGINQIIAVKIMHDVGRGFGHNYRELPLRFFQPCFFDDALCNAIILVYKTSTEPCGFDSVY